MKKNGFTLVEILAVLVLVSVIAIISAPSIINYINGNKEEISEVTKKLIATGTDLYIDNYKPDYKPDLGKEYCVTLNDVVNAGYLDSPIIDSVSGEEVDLNKFVQLTYYYNKSLGQYVSDYNIVDSCENKHYICVSTLEEDLTTGYLATGNYNYGDEYICGLGKTAGSMLLTFFMLEENEDSVSLLMNQNLGSTVGWCDRAAVCQTDGVYDNTKGPITAMEALVNRTENWLSINGGRLSSSQISLPTFNQIYNVNNSDVFGPHKWIYDYLKGTSNSVPNVAGYWTSSAENAEEKQAWVVRNENYIGDFGIYVSVSYGIRPVITIPKDLIKNWR